MLVLSRKKNESIVINNDITIVVVEIRGDKVRLGVEAPKEVPVHRREVYDAIHRACRSENGERDDEGIRHRRGEVTRVVRLCRLCEPSLSRCDLDLVETLSPIFSSVSIVRRLRSSRHSLDGPTGADVTNPRFTSVDQSGPVV